MRARTRLFALTASLLLAALSRTSSASDPAAAESLFRDAQELLAKGETARACEKLEESQRLDPTGATAMSLGGCLESLGRTASAWARYQEALEFARRKGAAARQRELEARIAAVAKAVPKLVVVVPSELAALEGFALTRNGTPVGRAQWNSAIAIDPGAVTIAASAPGRVSWATSLTTRGGETETVTVPPLAEVRAAPATSAPPSASTSSAAPSAPSASASAAPSGTTPLAPPASSPPVLGYVALGVGVVGIAAGAYFLARYASLSDQATALCSTSACGRENHDEAVQRSNDAGHAGTSSVVSFASGAVLSGVGVWLLLRPAGPSSAMTPWLGPTTIGGTWETRF